MYFYQASTTFTQLSSFFPSLPASIDRTGSAIIKNGIERFINHKLPTFIEKEVHAILSGKIKRLQKKGSSSDKEEKLEEARTNFELRFTDLQQKLSVLFKEEEDQEVRALLQFVKKSNKEMKEAMKSIKEMKKVIQKIEDDIHEDNLVEEDDENNLSEGLLGILVGCGCAVITFIIAIVIFYKA